MLKSILVGVAATLGVILALNGLYMILAPQPWYLIVPGVMETGASNDHFIRDIGLTYLLVGAGLVTGAARPAVRTLVWGAGGLWLAGHAASHLWQVATGFCGSAALWRDLPGVALPAAIALALAAWSIIARRREARRAPV